MDVNILGFVIPVAAVSGALLVRRPGHPVTILLTVMTFARLLIDAGPEWLVNPLWTLSVLTLAPLLVAFPDGPQGRWRWVYRYLLASIGMVAFATPMVAAMSPVAGTVVAVAFGVPVLPISAVRCGSLFRLWRRSTGERRTRIGLVMGAGAFALAPYVTLPLFGLVLTAETEASFDAALDQTNLFGLVFTIIPVAIGLSMLLEPVGRRLPWVERLWPPILGVGTALLLGGTVLSFGMAASDGEVTQSALAVAFAAISLMTIWGTRLVLRTPSRSPGPEERAAAALRDLAERLQTAPQIDTVPMLITSTIGRTLGLRGTRVEGIDEGGVRTLGSWGDVDGGAPIVGPLIHAGERVGSLVLVPHPDGVAVDVGVLDPLLPSLASAVTASGLLRRLTQANQGLIEIRDTERARLRADLHDELSPALSGARMAVHAATSLVRLGNGSQAADLLDHVDAGLAGASGVVREILEDLQPDALVQGDLASALRQRASAFHRPGHFTVIVEVANGLPQLASPVQTAILRVGGESVCNAARHSLGNACTLTLLPCEGGVALTVSDDGVGIPAGRREGVGLSSMAARTEAVGGSLTVSPGPHGGTTVRGWFPSLVVAPAPVAT